MKKVIDGSLYNTATARELGNWDNGIYGSLDSVQETLYRTKSGKYFLHGEGGARSRYAVCIDYNHYRGGEKIMPLSEAAARSWAEDHLPADQYLTVFAAIDADRHTVAVSDRCYAKLTALKDCTGKSFADLVETAVDKL